jgi:hypothetical protein
MVDEKRYILTISPIWTPPALRRVVPGKWPGIRKSLLKERGAICEICGFAAEESRYIDAHEVFEYLDDGMIRLASIQMLCKRCHDCKHFDQLLSMEAAGIREAGRAETVIEHSCHVNRCSRADFEENLQASRQRSEELRQIYGSDLSENEVHYGPYHNFVTRPRKPLNWWGALQRIRKLAKAGRLGADAAEFWRVYEGEIIDTVREDDPVREEIARLANAKDYEGAHEAVAALLVEIGGDDGWEFLPDHECPQATHMWRETFSND